MIQEAHRGFTLIELIIVIVILGILGAVAVPRVLEMLQSTEIQATKAEMLAIKKAIIGNPDTRVNGQMVDIGYRGDMGADPSTTEDLFDGTGKPVWDRFAQTGWNGPYMESDGTPATDYLSDEWGNAYDLSTAGEIKSLGPNGIDDSGAGDDIVITY